MAASDLGVATALWSRSRERVDKQGEVGVGGIFGLGPNVGSTRQTVRAPYSSPPFDPGVGVWKSPYCLNLKKGQFGPNIREEIE